MVTQFGYVTIWSIVWPLAPVFALINNYIELRTDALKICKHVRRPVGDRVETIGSWLETLVSNTLPGTASVWQSSLDCPWQNIIAWIGAVTNATLIYLFRPSALLHDQSPNPELPSTGSVYLHRIVSTYDISPTWRMVLPTLVPLAAVALAASHGFIVLRWIVEYVAERVYWKGSAEEIEVQKLSASSKEMSKQLGDLEKKPYDAGPGSGFWNGGEEGAREIGRVAKAE